MESEPMYFYVMLFCSLNCMMKDSPDEFAHDDLCADLEAHDAIYFGLENHYDVLSTAARGF